MQPTEIRDNPPSATTCIWQVNLSPLRHCQTDHTCSIAYKTTAANIVTILHDREQTSADVSTTTDRMYSVPEH